MNNPLARWPTQAVATLALLGMPGSPAFAEPAAAVSRAGVNLASGPVEHVDLAQSELLLGGQRYVWDPARPREVDGGSDVQVTSLRAGQWVAVQWEPGVGGYRRIRAIRLATVR